MSDEIQAKQSLDNIIRKARVHLYKPIQVAEILHRDRVFQDIDLSRLDTYRNASKRWRDEVCLTFLGRISTSSARYQDDLFNENATPPEILCELGKINRASGGVVEAYIYRKFSQRLSQVSIGLDYCQNHDHKSFRLEDFLGLFWNEPGLRRSIDKVYEIIVYGLFSALVDALDVRVSISMDASQADVFAEFEDFARQVVQLTPQQPRLELKAKIYRVGVTNAADRGLDMWANFGLAVQVKHLSLTEELAENIVAPVSSDRIVIVCKDAEERVIVSLLNQMGWKSRIQSVVTESHLITWYEKALRGQFATTVGANLLATVEREIKAEFPSSDSSGLLAFMQQRGYSTLHQVDWR
jgi:type II restriction enzyme